MENEWTVDRHLLDKPDGVVALYDRFIELVGACGPFTYSVTKTAITLKGSRRGFAGLKPRSTSLDGYLDLERCIEDPRIRRSGPYTKRLFVHQFRIVALAELDAEFAGWLREAYAVGDGAHLQAEGRWWALRRSPQLSRPRCRSPASRCEACRAAPVGRRSTRTDPCCA